MYDTQHLSVASIIQSLPPFSSHPAIFKADSGASKHFVRQQDSTCLSNVTPLTHGPRAKLPNNEYIYPIARGLLPTLSSLSTSARSSLVYPALKNASLLSIGQLCDNGCLALFDKNFLWILHNKKLLLKGRRNTTDGLWDIPFPVLSSQHKNNAPLPAPILTPTDSTQPSCNYILTLDKSKYELAQYIYGCLFAPTQSTLQQAIINGNLSTWPGIDLINFKKYVGTNLHHVKGHLDQERQNLRSTKHVSSPPTSINSLSSEDLKLDAFPSHTNTKCYHCYSIIIPAPTKTPKGISYSDQTGRFPYQSSRGNKYICVTYNYDANAILFSLLKNRESTSLVKAWEATHHRLTKNGHQVDLHILDNNISADFVAALDTKSM